MVNLIVFNTLLFGECNYLFRKRFRKRFQVSETVSETILKADSEILSIFGILCTMLPLKILQEN